MNDDGKPQNDMTQHDAQAQELTELLNLLEGVDRRITPEHVTKRFRELLDDIGDGSVSGAAADGQPRGVPGQMGCDGPSTSMSQEGGAARHAYLAGLRSSLEAAIAEAQSKAEAAADELRRAREATAAARQQAEQIVAEAQAQGDRALEQAVTIIRNARDQARQIRGEAESEADRIVSAADDRADEALRQAAEMVRAARQQSEQIISEARCEAEQIITAARDYPGHRNPLPVNGVGAFPRDAARSVAAAPAASLNGRLGGPPDLADISSDPGAAFVSGSVSLNTVVTPFGPVVRSPWQGRGGQGQAIQHGRPGEPLASAPPVDGQVCAMLAVDIVGFTRPDRDDDIRRHLHSSLYELLEKAFEGSGIPWAACYYEDRGDGALVVIPPGTPARGIIDPLPERLRRLIRRHNHVSRTAAGLQLRAAVHIGPVDHDGHGFVGTDINLLFRMLDARPLKRLIATSGAELGLAVSDYVYRALICRYPGSVSPDALQSVRFQTKKTRAHAWVYLPGSRPVSTVPDADSAAELPPRPPEADSKSEFRAPPGTNGQQIPITEPATAEDTMTSSPSQLVCDLWR